jgi:carbonic anhydrase
MVLAIIQNNGFETACVITLIAGLIQILFGLMGAAQLAFIISPAVIHAMLAGIGILISLGQVNVLLGFAPKSSAFANLISYPESILNMNTSATSLGLITLLVLLSWNRWGQKKISFIPGSLVAVVVGTTISYFMNLEVPRVQIGTDLFSGLTNLKLGENSLAQLIISALGLALVASAESLLCAVATDKLHEGPRVKLGKELVAQGVGNSLSGLLGGLPITGVIVRSSANISAGAKTNQSAILHGFWILVFSMFFSQVLNQIPLAVLAALLIYTGLNLVKIAELKKLMAFKESIIYFATLIGVVCINLLWGIGIGFVLATIKMIVDMTRFHFTIEEDFSEDEVRMLRITLSGNLIFLNVPKLLTKLNNLPKKAEVYLILNVDHLDHAIIEALHDWKQNYEKDGGRVYKQSLVDLWKDLKNGSLKAQTFTSAVAPWKNKISSPYFDTSEENVSEVTI